MSNNKRILSVVLALILALSVIPTMSLSVSAEETGYTAPEGFTPEPNMIYFDVNGTGWEMGAKDRVAFFIYGGDFDTEANPTTPYGWGGKKPIGTATTGVSGMYEIDPAAKLGYTFTEGIQYKISFVHTSGNKWIEQTHDLYFTTNCLGHVAYCNGETRPHEIDPSILELMPHWDSEDLDGGHQSEDLYGGLQFYYRRKPFKDVMDIDPTCYVITGYTGKKSDLEIPATIDSLPVDGIEDNAFEGNENLKSVKLPDSVSSIGDSAFYNCTALTDIPLPDSIWTIGNYAFANCAGLTNFSIPDTVRVIGSGAFSGCTGLTEINIPSSITTIKDSTFNYCTGLTSITIPDAVTKIEDYAFSRCTGLTKIVIPDSVTSIGDNAFSGCTGLTEIVIPDSVTEIGEGAFEGCTGLTSVKLPDSITGIEDDTFAGCTGLTDFTLPSSIEYVAKTAFEGTDFEGIWYNDQPDGVLYWGTKAMGYKGTCPETIWIRPGTTELEGEYYGYDLQTIVLPDGLEKIEDFKSSISSITLPDSVWSFPYKFNTTIGTDATGMTRYSFRPITIYGRKGSYAEIFVDNLNDPEVMKNLGPEFKNTYTFVPLQTREAKRVSVYPLEEEQELSVEDITDSFDKTAVPANFEIVKVYDVSIKKDGETVNPDRYFKLHLDTIYNNISASKSKVYRVEADGSLTDMRAEVVGSFEDVLFSTSRLGTFILTTGAEVKPPVCGDADGDGKVTVKDATFIQRYLVNLDSGIDVAVITRNGDVNGDGKVNVIDATLIQRYLSGIIDSFPSGKKLPTQAPSTVPTETEDVTQAATGQVIGQRDRNAHYEVETRVIWCENKGNRIYGEAYIPITDKETKFPLVIHAHGMGSNHEPGANYGKRYAEKGFATYSFDFPGGSRPTKENKSDGDPMKNSAVTEASDLQAILNTAMTWDFVDPNFIFLEGGSMGGFVATMVGLDNTDTVRGMILLFPALYFPQMVTARYNSPDDVPDTLSYSEGYKVSGMFARDLFGLDVVSRLNTYPHNVTIIQGSDDEKVSASSIKEAAALFPHAEFHLIEGAGHGFSGDDFDTSVEYGLDYLFANT